MLYLLLSFCQKIMAGWSFSSDQMSGRKKCQNVRFYRDYSLILLDSEHLHDWKVGISSKKWPRHKINTVIYIWFSEPVQFVKIDFLYLSFWWGSMLKNTTDGHFTYPLVCTPFFHFWFRYFAHPLPYWSLYNLGLG